MANDSQRRILLVAGPPAAGKTAIARPLAEALGFALLTKDDIKESLYASLGGTPGDVAFSRRLSETAMQLLWDLAPRCPQLVLEANFRTQCPFERAQVAALIAMPGTRLVEIFCRIPPEDAARRFADRARRGRHPAHALAEMSVEQLGAYGEPFALSEIIEVDTTIPVDTNALLYRVRSTLGFEPPALLNCR